MHSLGRASPVPDSFCGLSYGTWVSGVQLGTESCEVKELKITRHSDTSILEVREKCYCENARGMQNIRAVTLVRQKVRLAKMLFPEVHTYCELSLAAHWL